MRCIDDHRPKRRKKKVNGVMQWTLQLSCGSGPGVHWHARSCINCINPSHKRLFCLSLPRSLHHYNSTGKLSCNCKITLSHSCDLPPVLGLGFENLAQFHCVAISSSDVSDNAKLYVTRQFGLGLGRGLRGVVSSYLSNVHRRSLR